MTKNSLISVIKSARPRRALFTTFTLSLSWFEALVLPVLRQAQCQQIDLLVDARQAHKSTDEAASLYAGNAYRIIPVYMPKTTVFHPKIAYLQGWDDADVLTVASANLTASGHGGNLEVIDAISSLMHPGAFGEFAGFLLELTEKHSFSEQNLAALREYALRAQSFDTASEAERTLWLVHTLRESADKQFLVHARNIEAPHRLTVLAPFHSPSGKPVIELANALGVKNLRIGLDPATLIAPFKDASALPTGTTFVTPAMDEEPPRALHAKCFVLEGVSETLVMTGSVNATAQSLSSTENVEVSLVRMLPRPPFEWAKAKPSKFVPCDFNADEMTSRNPALQATWMTDNRLVGRVEPVGEDQSVMLRVIDGDEIVVEVDDIALERGGFVVEMCPPAKTRGALRLTLTGQALEATGWINLELDLTADDEQRNLAKASSRVMSDEFRVEDLDTIFSWLGSLHDRFTNEETPQHNGKKTTATLLAKEKVVESAPQMSYQEWRRSIETVNAPRISRGLTCSSVEAVIRWLNRDLTRPSNETSDGNVSSTTRPKRTLLTTDKDEFKRPDPVADDELKARAEERYQSLLEAIPKGLGLDARFAVTPLLVEISGCAQLKLAMLGSTPFTSGTGLVTPPLQAWLTRFAAFDYGEDNREVLFPFFSVLACCTAYLHPTSSCPALKEALETLRGRSLQLGEIDNAARLAFPSNRLDRVPMKIRPQVLAHAAAIEAAATQSQQLVGFILQTMDVSTRAAPTVPAPYATLFGALWRQRKNPKAAFGVLTRDTQRQACPCCCRTLQSGELSRLRIERAYLCANMICQRPIFYDVDTTVLDLHGLAGRYRKH